MNPQFFTKALLFLIITLSVQQAYSQKYLVLDRYGKKRIKLYPGDELWFKQKENKTFFHDYILSLTDSSVYLGSVGYELPLDEFAIFYFPNTGVRALEAGAQSLAGGFLIAAAVEPLVSNAFYDAQESALIGSSALGASLISRLFRWKKFRVTKNSRVRVLGNHYLNTSIRK